jgi:hypothetical protein
VDVVDKCWFYRFHLHRFESPKIIKLLYLASALVVDLGLNKALPKPDLQCIPIDPRRNCPSRTVPAHTMEERRALLGCFYLTSVFVSLLKQHPALGTKLIAYD